jgi:flagellar motor component MotA
MDFCKTYKQIVKRALKFLKIARKEGLLALESYLEEKKINERDVFEYGMRLVIDGTNYEIIDKILSNIIKQEKDETLSYLMSIQKDAVYSLCHGVPLGVLIALMNSQTDLSLSEDLFYVKFITGKILP